MKKLFKIFSLLLISGLLFTLTACVPSADKAKEKMEEAGYLSLDTNSFGIKNDKCENMFLFVLGDNVFDAGANFLSGKAEYLVVLYFKDKAEAKAEFEKTLENATENENNDFVYARSGKCIYYGSAAAAKEFK